MSEFFFSEVSYRRAQLTCTNLPLKKTNKHIRSISRDWRNSEVARRFNLWRKCHAISEVTHHCNQCIANSPSHPACEGSEACLSRRPNVEKKLSIIMVDSTVAQCARPLWPAPLTLTTAYCNVGVSYRAVRTACRYIDIR